MMNWPIARIYVRLLLLIHAAVVVVPVAGFLPFEWIQTESLTISIESFKTEIHWCKWTDRNETKEVYIKSV